MELQGFQRNPGVKTVEEDYHKAIHAAGGISDDNVNDFSKVCTWIHPRAYVSALTGSNTNIQRHVWVYYLGSKHCTSQAACILLYPRGYIRLVNLSHRSK